jgi:hypothetical protein
MSVPRVTRLVPDMMISIRRGGCVDSTGGLVGGGGVTATSGGGALVSGDGKGLAVCGTITELG